MSAPLILLALLLAPRPIVAAGLSWNDFQAMESEARDKLAARLVKPVGGAFVCAGEHYEVSSDLERTKVLETAVFMDNFYEHFSDIFVGRFREQGRPKLYAQKDQSSYAKVLGDFSGGRIQPGWSAGMFVFCGGKKALFANHGAGEEHFLDILRHEGTHQLLAAYLGKHPPVWLTEGAATNFETWDVRVSAMQNLQRMPFVSQRARHLAGIWGKGSLTMEKLTALDGPRWQGASGDAVPAQYSSAWAAVNTLLYSKPGKKFLNDVLTHIVAGKDPALIFSGKTMTTFEEMVRKHAEDFVLPCVRLGLPMEAALKAGDRTKAAAIAADFTKRHPDHPYARYYALALDQEAGKDPAAVLKGLQDLDKEEAKHPDLACRLAQAYLAAGQVAQAVAQAQRMLQAVPGHEGAAKVLQEARERMAKRP